MRWNILIPGLKKPLKWFLKSGGGRSALLPQQNANQRLRFKHFPTGTKNQDVTVAWQPLQHKKFSINSKSFATTIVSFMTVGPKSRLRNLLLLSCNTSDISESNLQLSLSSFSQELRSSGVAGNSRYFSADLNCKVSGPLLIRTGRREFTGSEYKWTVKTLLLKIQIFFQTTKHIQGTLIVRRRGLCLLHLSGLSLTLQVQAIITNHPRNKARGHACVTFMPLQDWIARDLL